jgi:hypothetical protein
MCPPKPSKPKRKPAVSRRRESIQNCKVMRWLDEERERQGISLRDVAHALGPGYRNATRIGQYFRQRIVAGPDMLARLAVAVKVSPIDALWNAGHHGAVLDYLLKLYRLGWSWARADNVAIERDTGANFYAQYADIGFPANGDLRIPPPNLADRYPLATVYNRAGIYRVVSLPIPMALAILLAVSLFPRRGEKPRPETTPLYEQLSFIASQIMPAAEIARVPTQVSVAMKKPLKEAEMIWKRRFRGRMRLAIIAEYIHEWCDWICRDYADYARVALYEHGAFVGEPLEHEDIWQWQSVEMPSGDLFKVKIEEP